MKYFLVIALATISLVSCKKDKAGNGAPAAVDGYWIGSWQTKTSSTKNDMAVILRNNGTVRILSGYSGGDTAQAYYVTEDHYTYENGVARFQSRESNLKFAYMGTAKGNTMSGTWGTLPSEDDGGTWTMALQH